MALELVAVSFKFSLGRLQQCSTDPPIRHPTTDTQCGAFQVCSEDSAQYRLFHRKHFTACSISVCKFEDYFDQRLFGKLRLQSPTLILQTITPDKPNMFYLHLYGGCIKSNFR